MSMAFDHGDIAAVPRATPFALSNKGRRFLHLYIQLYQVAHGNEVNKASLMQLRGCGERTATEILRWLNTMAMQQLSLLTLNAVSPEIERAANDRS